MVIKSSTAPVAVEMPILKTPGVCGGSACVRATRIPVWSLVLWRRQGVSDLNLLEMYPALNQADLDAAWAYDAAHREDIDRDIQENEDA